MGGETAPKLVFKRTLKEKKGGQHEQRSGGGVGKKEGTFSSPRLFDGWDNEDTGNVYYKRPTHKFPSFF